VDVHHNIFDVFRVPEGKFNRLNLASLTTATNYFRPTRILYYIDFLSEVASLFLYYCISLDLFESNNKKCNFLELNVSFLQLFKYCQRKNSTYNIPNTFISFDRSIILRTGFTQMGVCVWDLKIWTFSGVRFCIVYILR